MTKMKAGDILLFKAEKDFLSLIIAWGTNSKYTHVAVCVSPEMNLAIEALTKGGVRARDIRKIKQDVDIFRVKEDSSYDVTNTVSYLVNKLNLKYDYTGVIFLGILKLIAKIFKPLKKVTNKWQKDEDYFCSELCYKAFNFGGLDIVPEVSEADITSPGDIARSEILEMVRG
ncbi:MAG: hypothetical protein KAI70_02110 [Candidatus Omnitrophica bacterium]|nr:hypothetical protein [Candidatus Omnitrophota bacterium]